MIAPIPTAPTPPVPKKDFFTGETVEVLQSPHKGKTGVVTGKEDGRYLVEFDGCIHQFGKEGLKAVGFW